MKKIYLIVLTALTMLLTLRSDAQTVLSIGTASATQGSSAAHPYPTYYTTARVQFLVTAAEIAAAGISGQQTINSIAFNVASVVTGSGSCNDASASGWCTNNTVNDGTVINYKIGFKNTSQALPLTSYDFVGITDVYSVFKYTPTAGWNTHTANIGSFVWDGVSNVLVDICVANIGTICGSYNYVSNSNTYYTATKDNSIVSGWADSQGSWCGSSFPNSCNYSPSGSASTYRPDCRLTFTPLAPPAPPTPNFQFTLGTDTLWDKSISTLINTSTNAAKSYWNITSYSANSATGPWTNYTNVLDTLQCNSWGCFLDTVKNDPNLYYTFANRGFYKVKLTTVNSYGTNSIEKVVLVDTPRSKPSAMFYATRRQLGANDRVRMNNLSTSAPARVKWWLVNTCTGCPVDTNAFLPNDSAFNPVLAAYTPGVYKVCLAASNSKGSDTFCRNDYLKILPGYLLMHNETGRYDTVSRDASGYLYSDLRTAAGVNLSGQFQPTATSPIGFRIAPCADTIYVELERLRMRTTGTSGGDSLYLRLNGYTGPIVRRWGGNNINALKDTTRFYKFAGQALYVTYSPAITTPPATIVNDSGFTLRWSSSPSFYSKPVAGFTCPDTLYSGYKVRFMNTTVGVRTAYAWDLNNDGVFGQDKPSSGIDSITLNPTITYTTTTPTTRKICLKSINCVGVDTFCKTVPLLPIQFPPSANFTTSRTIGLITDTFQFIDKSSFGATSWKWRFEPNNVTWLSGSDSTTQSPFVSLNAAQSYDVTLIATNPLGSNSIMKAAIVSAIDYGSPGSAFPPVLDATDFGISRVIINGADKRLDTITPLKSPTYTRLYNDMKTTVFRGGKYKIEIYRNTANDAQSLRVWADYNRDADYNDEFENVYAENLTKNVKSTVDFEVPASAQIGNSRILIGACNNISNISSTTANVGVYEDYGMIIGNDFVKPVIKLNGSINMVSELNKSFVDPGVTATDNIQGDITNLVQIVSTVNTSALGLYSIKYWATDMYGNTSDTVYRNVNIVLNSSGPVLTVTPDSVNLEVFNTFVEPGYSASGNTGNDLTPQVQRTGFVDNTKLGYYTLTYTITDAFGLTASKNRVVNVRDTEKPVIASYLGNDTVVHQIGSPFDDNKYVQITDNYWQDMTPIRVSGSIDANKAGIYRLTYKNTDGSGNTSDEYALYVKVTNKVLPTISLIGSAVVVVPVFGRYNDLGVIAKDYKGDILSYSSNLNDVLRTDTIWDAEVVYTASDGFSTVSVLRKILVRDVESPVIELLGENPVVLGLCKSYNDPGIKVTDNFDPLVITSTSKNDGNGMIITIDSSKVNPCGGGFYYTVYINATDRAGNKAEEKKRIVYVSAVGTADIFKTEGFNLFPNPASSFVNIEMEKGVPQTVTVYDIQGKATNLVPVKDVKGYRLDLNGLSNGMYLIRIETVEGGTFSGKFSILNK